MHNVWKLSLNNPNITDKEVTTSEYIELFDELFMMSVKSIAISGVKPTLRKDITGIIRNPNKETWTLLWLQMAV